MRSLPKWTVWPLLTLTVQICVASEQSWRPIETNEYAWRTNAAPYAFIIEDYAGVVGQGDENSPRLRIVDPKGGPEIESSTDGLLSIDEALGENCSLANDNLIPSHYVYMSPRLHGSTGEPILFAFGHKSGGEPGPILLFKFGKQNQTLLMFVPPPFTLVAIDDIDGDGVPEMIGRRTFAHPFDDCREMYNPFVIYKFDARALPSIEYSLSLSRDYSERHYGDWSGPDPRLDTAVSTCGANKGRIVPKPGP